MHWKGYKSFDEPTFIRYTLKRIFIAIKSCNSFRWKRPEEH